MAKFDAEIPEEFIKNLEAHGSNITDVMISMCDKIMDYLIPLIQDKAPVYKGYLKLSFQKRKPRKNKYGEIIGKFGSYGYEEDSSKTYGYPYGKPHAIKAIVAEYGSRFQKKKPFLRPVMLASERQSEAILQTEYDKSIENLK